MQVMIVAFAVPQRPQPLLLGKRRYQFLLRRRYAVHDQVHRAPRQVQRIQHAAHFPVLCRVSEPGRIGRL